MKDYLAAVRRLPPSKQDVVLAGLDQLIDRCRALKLRAPGNVRDLRQSLIRLLSRKIAPSIFRAKRRQWFAL